MRTYLARDIHSKTVHVFRGMAHPDYPTRTEGRAACGRLLAVAVVVRASDERRLGLRPCRGCPKRLAREADELGRVGSR